MFPNDHPFVNRVARIDEKPAARLQVIEGIGNGCSRPVGHKGAGKSTEALSPEFIIPVKKRMHDAGAMGIGEKFVPVTDQPLGGHGIFNPNPAAAVVGQADHLAFAAGKLFGHHAHKTFITVHQEPLHGFEFATVFISVNDFGPAYAEFITFTPHGFDENSQLKFPATFNQDAFLFTGFLQLNGHIHPELFLQPLPNPAELNMLALSPAKG